MRALEDMCELLEQQIKEISKKGDAISPQELDNAYKAVDIIKDIQTIKAMKKAEQEEMMQSQGSYARHMPMQYPEMMSEASYARGGSSRGSYAGGGSYGGSYGSYEGQSNAGGQSNAMGGQSNEYSEDYSGRRGRGRDGRYVSRDGGSYGNSGGSYGNSGGSYGYSGAEDQEKEQLKQQIKQMEQKLNQM